MPDRNDLRTVSDLIDRGCSPAEAVDYYMVVGRDLTQTEWAGRRGVSQSTVSENVSKANAKIA